MAPTLHTITAAATQLGLDVATIRAIAEVESDGSGFLRDGRPKILFEAHWFGKLTGYVHNANHPNISSHDWNRSLYARGPDADARGVGEWERIQKAIRLNRTAALKSASWGTYQIMGFNYDKCGFHDVEAFVAAMNTVDGQLTAFVRFVAWTSNGTESQMVRALKARNWALFASIYNGPAYKVNQYDTKLAAAYAKYKDLPVEPEIPEAPRHQVNTAPVIPNKTETAIAGSGAGGAVTVAVPDSWLDGLATTAKQVLPDAMGAAVTPGSLRIFLFFLAVAPLVIYALKRIRKKKAEGSYTST